MQLDTGKDDRSNGWVFTCDRWAELDVYILLPINPETFEFSNPIHASEGERYSGKYMYFYRNPKSGSQLMPCNYHFSIPSGFIIPEFSPDYIKQAADISKEAVKKMRFERNGTQPVSDPYNYASDVRDGIEASQYFNPAGRQGLAERALFSPSAIAPAAGLPPNDADMARIRAMATEAVKSKLDGKARNFSARVPNREQVGDHRYGRYQSLRSAPRPRNVPMLYLPHIPIGIQNFWAFLALLQEPRVFTDTHGRVRNNRVIVHWNSIVFPYMTFYGWFDPGGISYSESSETPGEFNIEFDIFVTGSNPVVGYKRFADLMRTYKVELTSPTWSVDRLRAELDKLPNDSRAEANLKSAFGPDFKYSQKALN